MKFSFSRRLTVPAVLCLAALASAAPAAAATATAPDPALRAQLGALQEPAAATVPADVRSFAATSGAADVGALVGATRRVAAPGGGSWDVIPGTSGACLYVESLGAGTCAPTKTVLAGLLQVIEVPPPVADGFGGWHVPQTGQETRYGLAPRGVTVASATGAGQDAGGQVSPDGLYRLRSSSAIASVTLHRVGRPALVATSAHGLRAWNRGPRARSASGYGYIPGGGTSATYNLAGYFGPFVSLTAMVIWSFDGNMMCENARDRSGVWAGNGVCTFTYVYGTNHPYNGSTRQGWAGSGTYTNVIGQAEFVFN